MAWQMFKNVIDDQELDIDLWVNETDPTIALPSQHGISLLTILSITWTYDRKKMFLGTWGNSDYCPTAFIAGLVFISLLLEFRSEELTAGEKWVELDVLHGAAENRLVKRLRVGYISSICLWFCIFSSNNRIRRSLRYHRLRLVIVFLSEVQNRRSLSS